ncbi:MAG: hypothetical protein LKJ47_05790 [Bifidobacteriaceae bacterium]|jgi:hypothetical protein|nr:hypothetical protein [Bifidobacteriaceae bacterium]
MTIFHTRESHTHKFRTLTFCIALCDIAIAIGLSFSISTASAYAGELKAQSTQRIHEAAKARLEILQRNLAAEKYHADALLHHDDARIVASHRLQRASSIKSGATGMVHTLKARQAAAKKAKAEKAAKAAAAAAARTASYSTTSTYTAAPSYARSAYRSNAGTSYTRARTRSTYSAPRAPRYSAPRTQGPANHGIARTCSTSNQPAACQSSVNGGGLVQINAGNRGANITVYAAHDNAGGAWIQGVNNGDAVKIGGRSYKAAQTRHISKSNPQMATQKGQVWLQTCEKNGTTMKLVLLQRR